MQFFLAFAVCLLGLWISGYLYFKAFSPTLKMPRRIDLVETLPLLDQTNLLLIRRDQTTHLLLVGAARDQIVGSQPTPAVSSTTVLTNKVAGVRPLQIGLSHEVLHDKLVALARELSRY
jgi:hypothetical protein